MTNHIGRFEILSEITHSEIGAVYKATDPESGQTIALKTIRLQMVAEQAPVLVEHILQEAEGTKPLNSHNIALLYGVEEIDGQFCAAMEYVQGNSIGTMLARKEGFSIWDLQDIARQTCQGLDHAHSHQVVHYSLEPAKIMVTWDGTVKILSFGISSMGAFTCQASGDAPDVLHYVSPEQLRGDPVDARSNVFSLGAILYEMVTETKAFAGGDADQVRHAIVEVTPIDPAQLNRKIHPVLSEVIMKALSKAPEDRYQRGQELSNDLERCKENAKALAKQPAQPPQGLNAPQGKKPAVSDSSPPPAPETQAAAVAAGNAASLAPADADGAESVASRHAQDVASPPSPARAAAAAAGWESAGGSFGPDQPKAPKVSAQSTVQERASAVADTAESASTSPAFYADPAMAEGNKDARGPSFSEISELPPLKEVYAPPPPPPELIASIPRRDRGAGRPTKRERRDLEKLRGLEP